jgi:HEAT repeat protein
MKPRLVIALGIAGLCVLAAILVVKLTNPGPNYHQHSVKFWVGELAAPEPRRRDEAAAAFQALGSKSVPALVKLLGHRDSFLRQKAWEVASKLPTRLAAFVRRQAGPLEATAARRGAARALTLLGPQAHAAAPALGQALHDTDQQVRWEVAQALGHLGPTGVPALASVLADKDPQLRYCAVSGLGCANPEAAPLAAPPLFQALADTNSTVSFSAGDSLTKLGTNAMPFLAKAMARPDPVLRQRAAKALGSVRYRRLVVPLLVEMLHDPEPACRTVAVQTLARLGLPDHAMTQAYMAALKDPEATVRLGAVQGLAQARTQGALIRPALTACLDDQSPKVREAAARALAHSGAQAQPASTNLAQPAAP